MNTTTTLETHYADLPCPVIVREVESGTIVYANAAAAELAGVAEPGEIIGRTAAEIWPGNADRWREADLEALRRGATTRRVEAGRGHWLRVHRRAIDRRHVLVAIADETPAAQLQSLRMLSGSKPAPPRPIGAEPTFAALLLRGSSIADICAALRWSPARVLGALAKVAGLSLR